MVYICGQPHVLIGGANSEALDNAAVLVKAGIPVTLVPYATPDPTLARRALELGCEMQPYAPGCLQGKIVAGWNHLPYLQSLMVEKPKCSVYFNCMTETSAIEIALHRNQKINVFGFVSRYQRNILCTELGRIGRVTAMDGYVPPITTEWRTFGNRMSRTTGTIGCMTRDDPTKVNLDVFKIAGRSLAKKLIWMGYGTECQKKIGPLAIRPDKLFVSGPPNFMPVDEFFNSIDCCLHLAGPVGESFCRIMLESFLAGVPFVCENKYAFPEYMTGAMASQMCDSTGAFVEKINMILGDSDYREEISRAQSKHLQDLDLNRRCVDAWKRLLSTHA